MRNTHNYGISIGTAYGPTAMGAGAIAQQNGQDPRLASAVEELRQLIGSNITQVRQANLVLRDITRLADQVHEPESDPDEMHDLLKRITDRAGAIGGVATAAGSIWSLIQQIAG
jgi:hypothetical protein